MTDIFDNDKPVEQGTPADQSGSPAEQLLMSIKNPDGTPKYKTVEEALKGAAAAQEHIHTLESENKEWKSKAQEGATLDKVLERLNPKNEEQDEKPEVNQNKPFTLEDVAKVVDSVLTQRTQESARESNVKTVTGKFKELYGDKASETLYGAAEDLGFTVEGINELIATNPKAALKILGVSDNSAPVADPAIGGGIINTANMQEGQPEAPKSVMGYVSSEDLVDSFKQSSSATYKRLGIDESQVKYV